MKRNKLDSTRAILSRFLPFGILLKSEVSRVFFIILLLGYAKLHDILIYL